jgi:hypothetical protein
MITLDRVLTVIDLLASQAENQKEMNELVDGLIHALATIFDAQNHRNEEINFERIEAIKNKIKATQNE